jgi:hypothetical protein
MAPKDGRTIIVYAPPLDGLEAIVSLCAWHNDAGFCIDELREPTHWQPFDHPRTGGDLARWKGAFSIPDDE